MAIMPASDGTKLTRRTGIAQQAPTIAINAMRDARTVTFMGHLLTGIAPILAYIFRIEKIKNVFLAILRDIKKDIDNGEQPGEAVTAAMFQAMRDALAEQKQNPLSIDDVAAMVAGQIGQLTPMDEETADLFKQLAKKMMKGIE